MHYVKIYYKRNGETLRYNSRITIKNKKHLTRNNLISVSSRPDAEDVDKFLIELQQKVDKLLLKNEMDVLKVREILDQEKKQEEAIKVEKKNLPH